MSRTPCLRLARLCGIGSSCWAGLCLEVFRGMDKFEERFGCSRVG